MSRTAPVSQPTIRKTAHVARLSVIITLRFEQANGTFSTEPKPPQSLYTRTCTRTFMATKTLTITEDAYNLLAGNKLEDESFSEEIKRIMVKRSARSLKDYFGILSPELGAGMLEDLRKIKELNRKSLRKRIYEIS